MNDPVCGKARACFCIGLSRSDPVHRFRPESGCVPRVVPSSCFAFFSSTHSVQRRAGRIPRVSVTGSGCFRFLSLPSDGFAFHLCPIIITDCLSLVKPCAQTFWDNFKLFLRPANAHFSACMNACSVLFEVHVSIVYASFFVYESSHTDERPDGLSPLRKRRVFVEKCGSARAVESTGTNMIFQIRFMHNAQLLKINI